MTQIIAGIFIGIGTSFIAGLFLLWKGENLVSFLQRLPEKRRISVFTRAYILGLRSYPYRFIHFQALYGFAAFLFIILVLYGMLTYASFYMVYGDPSQSPREAFKSAVKPAISAAGPVIPWLLGAITVYMGWHVYRFVRHRLLPEALAPYGYYEMARLHDCVAKFGTKKQYLDYVNTAHNVHDRDGLFDLLSQAERAIGEAEFLLIKEIRLSLTESAQTVDADSDNES